MPRRCELGCSHNPGVTQHQFPHPEKNPELFKAWVNIVGGKLETADDIKFYRKRVICDIHFADKFKNRNNRLNNIAVPTLHLQGAPSQDAHMPPATPHIPTELPMPEHNIWNLPSTSKQIVTGAPSQDAHMPPATPHIPTELPMPEHNIWDLPSTSKQIITAAPPNACVIAAEHNYCSKHGIQQRRKLKGDKTDEQIQMMFGHGVQRNAIQTEQQAPDLIGLRKIIKMVNSNNSNTDTSYIGEDAGDASDYFYAITKQSSLNPEVEAFIPKANIKSSSNCHKEPENKNNIEEYATNLKLKISDAAKSNSYDLKREKNVAIATLLKLYANNDTPVKLCPPEYFENKLEKPSTSNSSYCNSSTPLMLPQDTEMKKSIEKVNNWLEPTKRKTQAVSLEPIFFKRKTVQTVKSPANSEGSKPSQNARKFIPSEHAAELAKKYEQNNKNHETDTEAVTWANLQEKLREKDSLIKNRSEGKKLESSSSIQ